MRLSFAVAAFAATLATADVLVAADLTTMQETFDHLFTGMDFLVAKVVNFNPDDKAAIEGIVSDANMIERAILDGTAKMKKSQTMTLPDLLNILGPVMVMENKVGEIVDTLSTRKADLKKAGAEKQVLDALVKEKIAADGLVTAILANLPMASVVGTVARPIAAMITDRLDKGIIEWGGTPGQKSADAAAAAPKPKGSGWGSTFGLKGFSVEHAVSPVEFTQRFMQELKNEAEARGDM